MTKLEVTYFVTLRVNGESEMAKSFEEAQLNEAMALYGNTIVNLSQDVSEDPKGVEIELAVMTRRIDSNGAVTAEKTSVMSKLEL